MNHIPLSYTPIDIRSLADVLGGYAEQHHNTIITDFENEIKNLTGAPHVVAVASGTAAIHLALLALGIGQDDEVCVSTFTYVGSVSPILYVGARPVFIDCESETWNMDPVLLEEAVQSRIRLGKKPKAILVVHSYGMPAKMEELLDIGMRYDIPVIEDAAEALGSTYKGRHLGTLGAIGILSFNSNKLLTTYGGGAILADDPLMAEKVLYWATQARQPEPYYQHTEIGYSYRMSCLNAAMGLAQMQQLPALLAARKEFFEAYYHALQPLGFEFCKDEPDGSSNRWLSTVLLPAGNFSVIQVVQEFGNQGIEVRPLWKPMHEQPVFAGSLVFENGIASAFFRRGLCLPSGGTFSRNIIECVTAVLYKLLR